MPLSPLHHLPPTSSENEPGVIVIVDDESMVTMSLKAMLSLETDYVIHCFNTPQEALASMETLRPDVVLSDFLMPEMDGIAFLQKVREVFENTTLMLLTGYADKESAIHAINQVGIYRYIEKPWNNDELKINIRNGVERCRLLNDIAQRKEIERLREDFVSTLTHDLRTPLLAAIQTLGFFTDGSLGPLVVKQLELLTMLTQSLREMLGLVNVLLEVYKYEAGRQQLIWDTVNLNDLVHTITQELNALANQKEQTLQVSLGELPLMVRGDKQELRRVLVNLVGNALHYTPAQGHIHVRGALENGRVVITVKDNGRGIPKDDIPKLFQRFSQGTTLQRSSGTGLGLYLSRQIVDVHDGEIWVHSVEGEGSQFFVSLPPLTPSEG